MTSALILLAALLLDRLLGDPRRFHPLAGFGRLALWLETHLHGEQRRRGIAALLLAVTPFVLMALLLEQFGTAALPLQVVVLYFTLGATSLVQHGRAVADALTSGDLPLAQTKVGWMVSRDTAQLDAAGVARAACESVLENGNDAIFGAIFWFVLLGLPGAMLYRLVNTLDAMWGYRTPRYRRFGWAAARLDDLLNYLPARLTALSYTLLGDAPRALRCWREQGHRLESPNGGPVMSAGAGALALTLGGPASYHGTLKQKPWIGEGGTPVAADIGRTIRLVQYTLLLWLVVILIGGFLVG